MNSWTRQIFRSQIARRGGVVRRKITSIARYSSRAEVKRACRAKRYHIVAHGDQWLIFCDPAQVRIVL